MSNPDKRSPNGEADKDRLGINSNRPLNSYLEILDRRPISSIKLYTSFGERADVRHIWNGSSFLPEGIYTDGNVVNQQELVESDSIALEYDKRKVTYLAWELRFNLPQNSTEYSETIHVLNYRGSREELEQALEDSNVRNVKIIEMGLKK